MKEYNAVGVSFKQIGKVYDFLAPETVLNKGDYVIVESDQGEDIAQIVIPNRLISINNEQVMKPIIIIATEKDLEENKQNRLDEPKAFEICKNMVSDNNLDMKLLMAEYTLDRSKLTFYFIAEGRIDFRQLVKDLARIFKTRIEMRQIGVRDATKMIGGFGLCGREFCCSSFLRRFDNISIKMAKNQNLILNPNKISGVCGRLMCCLMFEKDHQCCGKGLGCNCNGIEEDDIEYIEIDDNFPGLLGDDK